MVQGKPYKLDLIHHDV